MTNYTNPRMTGSGINDATGRFDILSRVREDMDVYDVRDDHIGHVDFVHFGAASDAQEALGTGPATLTPADDPDMRRDTIIDNIAEAFQPNEVPEQFQAQLLMSGYIRMDAHGLFAADRFIMPDQIARVEEDRVYLNVNRDQLIKRR
jgi:hypothetical protein